MKGYFQLIKTNLFKRTDVHGLSVFRMFYVLILGCEVLQFLKYQELIYNESPFIYALDFSFYNLFLYWLIILFFLFFGLFTRFATILNYLFSILVFSQQHKFEYHIFPIYVGINFLLMFMPIARVFSLDSLIEKLKYSRVGKFYDPENKIYALYYFVPVFVGIGLVYFWSVFCKITSPMWLNGLGLWLPASLPVSVWNNTTFVLNNELLMKFTGYFVMVFEAVFIFLMWFKRFRLPLFIIGVVLHIGILICFPIPWFALTVAVIYLLMLPGGIWKKINFKFKEPAFTFYYDDECPLCIKTVVLINNFNIFGSVECKSVQKNYASDKAIQVIPFENTLLEIYGVNKKNNKIYKGYDTYIQLLIQLKYTVLLGYFMKFPIISNIGRRIYSKVASRRSLQRCSAETCNMPVFNEPIAMDQSILLNGLTRDVITRKFWKYLIFLFIILQAIASIPVIGLFYKSNGQKKIAGILALTKPIRHYSYVYLGLVNHDVFLDEHFNKYNNILKITYKENNREINLPIINENGMPDYYLRGILWRNFTFDVNSPYFREKKFRAGIKRYLLYWLNQNKKHVLRNYDFKVYIKEIEIPKEWRIDFLNEQISKPWRPCGNININEGYVTVQLDSTIH